MKFYATLGLFTFLFFVQDPAICGNLYYLQDGNGRGLYQLDTSTGEATLVSLDLGDYELDIGLSEGPHPEYLFFGSPDMSLKGISPRWETTTIGDAHAEGLGFDPDSGILYGILSSGEFYTISVATGSKVDDLTPPPHPVSGLAVLDGMVYGMEDRGGGRLLSYDPVANSWSVVGSTGLLFRAPGLASDPDQKVLYAIGVSGSNLLYKIDPDTAAAMAVGPTGSFASGGGLAYVSFSRPDVSVSTGSSKAMGAGVFQPTDQTVRVRRGDRQARMTARIRITNTDRNDVFTLKVGYSYPGLRSLDIRTHDGKKIGANVFSGRRTPLLEAGESVEMEVIFRFFNVKIDGRHRNQFRMTAQSSGDSSLLDSARILIFPPPFVKPLPDFPARSLTPRSR